MALICWLLAAGARVLGTQLGDDASSWREVLGFVGATAGMSLLDSLDGWFMTAAYGLAFSKPGRRLLYNIVLTGLSATVALGVGTVELLSVPQLILRR